MGREEYGRAAASALVGVFFGALDPFGLIVGIILGIILALFGVIFAEGVAMPPVGFGLAGMALVAGLVLFVLNLLGGFLGGRLGER